jgi:sulfotransferase family protein
VKAVRKWPWYVHAARAAGARLAAQDRYHEVRYEELVTDPEAALRRLLDFLGEPWDDAVLEYDRQPHDVQPRYAAFSSSRRTAAGERSAIYRSRVGAGRRELDPLLRLLVRLVDGATLRELGYS